MYIQTKSRVSILLFVCCCVYAWTLPVLNTPLVKAIDDPYEDNDSIDTAIPIELNRTYVFISEDVDFWNVSVPNSEYVQVVVTYSNPGVDIGFRMYNSSGSIVAYSLAATPTQKFTIHWSYGYVGNYTIEVNQTGTYQSENYTLEITLIKEDQYEPNNWVGAAKNLTMGLYSNLGCLDNDYFNMTKSNKMKMLVRVDYNPYSFNNLRLWILNSTGQYIFQGDDQLDRNGIVEFWITDISPQNYSIHISSWFICRYNLTITESSLDDFYEPNNNAAAAPLLSPGSYELVAMDEDFFNISVYSNSSLKIEIRYLANPLNEFTLWVYNCSNMLIFIGSDLDHDGNLTAILNFCSGQVITVNISCNQAFLAYNLTLVSFQYNCGLPNNPPNSGNPRPEDGTTSNDDDNSDSPNSEFVISGYPFSLYILSLLGIYWIMKNLKKDRKIAQFTKI